jgi:hypothetical protein
LGSADSASFRPRADFFAMKKISSTETWRDCANISATAVLGTY